jgi:hypothetical protein
VQLTCGPAAGSHAIDRSKSSSSLTWVRSAPAPSGASKIYKLLSLILPPPLLLPLLLPLPPAPPPLPPRFDQRHLALSTTNSSCPSGGGPPGPAKSPSLLVPCPQNLSYLYTVRSDSHATCRRQPNLGRGRAQ